MVGKPESDLKARIQPASVAVGPLDICVYGRNGMGKTHFTGTSDLHTLIIDCNEKGFETVADRPNVDVYQLTRWPEMEELYWWAREGKHDYEVFAIDTISMLNNICLRFCLGSDADRDNTVDPMMPSQRHYGKLSELMKEEILRWRNLPFHTIFLAQERKFILESDDGDGKELIEIAPSLTPAPLQTLLAAVGTVGRLYTREVERVDPKTKKKTGATVTQRRMLVGADEKYVAKTRIKGLKKVIIDPRLDKLLALRAQRGEVPAGLTNPDTAEDFE